MSENRILQEFVKTFGDDFINKLDIFIHSCVEEEVKSLVNVNSSENKFWSCYKSRHYPYCSQVGQDRYLNEYIFQDKKNGFFVDIGAYDGYMISNSYFFEDKLNWDGICVEPIPHEFKKLKENRKCKCINAAVSQKRGELKFILDEKTDMLSRLYENKYKNIINNKDIKIINVPSVTLNDILEGIDHTIDFISIDTEGTELDVLKSLDIEKFDIKAFVIEDNYKDGSIKSYLNAFGYKHVTNLGELDDIYVKKDFL